MVEHFPPIEREMRAWGGADRNPAIQLFGRRYFADQTVPELLVELLLVASSGKRIGEEGSIIETILPNLNLLANWPGKAYLEYAAKARLNLKLFSFLGASKLETRHESHRQHYRELLGLLQSPAKLVVSGTVDRLEVMRTLENLFLGFQGVGGNRTWCAQSFLPVIRELIGGESIWRETRARGADVGHWSEALNYFAHSQQIFLARGGELLYLQICNALRQDANTIQKWAAAAELSLSPRERIPQQLHDALEAGINSVLNACPDTIGKLAKLIDSGVEGETASHTDMGSDGNLRYTRCGWCPTESWPEGLLFAVEMLRLCEAAIDPIERLELMEIACAMQVLRSLCAQSARYVEWSQERNNGAGPLSYVWVISDPEGRNSVLKQISRRSVNAVQRMIYEAVRHSDIRKIMELQRRDDDARGRRLQKPYREADTRYGYKLFLTLGKRIGLIVPKRGSGARFVLNEKILRYLVMTVIRPGQKVTYQTFKHLVFAHYGIVMDDDKIGKACEWCGTGRLTTLGGEADTWVIDMLEAAGVLVRLSDSHSLITNPFDSGE